MSSPSVSEPIRHGYSVLRVITDDVRGDSVPVGVVAWDTTKEWFQTRVIDADEKVTGVPKWARTFLSISVKQLDRWASAASVPYEPGPTAPYTDRFWGAASEVMSTAVRLDSPKAMEPMTDPVEQLEGLFDAIVRPRQSESRRAERIDGALSRALGELSDWIPNRQEVSAFGNARETVRRGLVTDRGLLILEGVNLAAANAREGADALVSRVLRIQEAYAERDVKVIVGYTASPGGLNGETHMRDWIRTRLTPEVFDLVQEDREFQEAARTAWNRINSDSQGTLFGR